MTVMVMIWTSSILKQASKDGKKVIRRWKTGEKQSELFCSRKDIEHGRHMSVFSLHRMESSVIIIPKWF